MAGHSKWANIQHRKGRVDAQRGKLWTRLSRAIIVAAREGGGDPDANFRLRKAVDDAKVASMPKDNIERAIKRGTGELEGGDLEEIVYEGYGPAGVAILCDILTDNRNRTAPELRKLFDLHGGKMAESGAVAWMFERKGQFILPRESATEETLMELALENGAEDVLTSSERFEITCSPEQFDAMHLALVNADISCESSQVTRIPQNLVELDAATARQVLKLVEALDDHNDVQNVHANFDLPEDVLAEIMSQ